MEEEKLYMTIGIEELVPEGPSTFQKRLTKIDSDSERQIYSFIREKDLFQQPAKITDLLSVICLRVFTDTHIKSTLKKKYKAFHIECITSEYKFCFTIMWFWGPHTMLKNKAASLPKGERDRKLLKSL